MNYVLDALSGQRALSPTELYERDLASISGQRQATMTYDLGFMLRNYRMPVYVPDGWSDWYAVGDQLH